MKSILIKDTTKKEREEIIRTSFDCGSIYFWIRKQDLKERRFDNAWLVLQCF